MDTKQAQEAIAAAVARRGYMGGWTPGQLAARNGVKLAEELAELMEHIVLPAGWEAQHTKDHIHAAGRWGRMLFKDSELWRDAGAGSVSNRDAAILELADIAVVVSCLAYALDEPDILARALEKATADEKRGVR